MLRNLTALTVALFAAIATAAPAFADAQGDLLNAFVAFSKVSTFHIEVAAHGKTMDGDVVNPGKMHFTADPLEVIVISGTTYVKINGSWQKFTMPGMDRVMAPVTNVQNLTASHPEDVTVTDLGPKTVDGISAHAYLVKTKGNDRPVTVYVDGSGLPVRVDSTDSTGVSIVRFSKFNAPITIVAPI